jgi:hypothetical protein
MTDAGACVIERARLAVLTWNDRGTDGALPRQDTPMDAYARAAILGDGLQSFPLFRHGVNGLVGSARRSSQMRSSCLSGDLVSSGATRVTNSPQTCRRCLEDRLDLRSVLSAARASDATNVGLRQDAFAIRATSSSAAAAKRDGTTATKVYSVRRIEAP